MRRAFVRRWLYPAQEILQGRNFLSLWEELTDLQWRPAAELRERQEARLRAVFRQAREHVPFHAERLKAAGLGPDDIRGLDDLPKLPILTREEMRRAFPRGMAADNIPARRAVRDRTSGSTGVPLEFIRDRASRDPVLASFLLFNDWAGIRPGDRTVHFGAPQPFRLKSRLSAVLRGHTDLSVFDLNDEVAGAFLDRLARLRPALLEGFASTLFVLAQTALRRGVRLSPRAIVTTSETLPAEEPLRRAFGCPVFNRYGDREVGGALAQDCGLGRGLHVNTELCVLEVVDERGLPVPAGARGRVLVTDLNNLAMPLIRLDTGDEAEAGGACGCGRGFPLIAAVEGRVSELLVSPGGRRVSPGSLGHYLFVRRGYAERILKFRARQERPDRVTVRVVPLEPASKGLPEDLRSDLESLLGPDMAVEVQIVESIPPGPGGKSPMVESLISHNSQTHT